MDIIAQGIVAIILIGIITGLAFLVDQKNDIEDYKDDE